MTELNKKFVQTLCEQQEQERELTELSILDLLRNPKCLCYASSNLYWLEKPSFILKIFSNSGNDRASLAAKH